MRFVNTHGFFQEVQNVIVYKLNCFRNKIENVN